MTPLPRRLRVPILVWLLAAGPGCATVDPLDRALLADPIMMFDSDPMEANAREHLLRAREGSAGAVGGGGGGCGCEQ